MLIWLFLVILVLSLAIASGLRFLLPLENHSAAFWILQTLCAVIIGIYNGRVTFQKRWEKPKLLEIGLAPVFCFLQFAMPAWLGIDFGFGINPALDNKQPSSEFIEGLEGVVPAILSIYLAAFFIGAITTSLGRRRP